ncbi:hypothetical protein SN4111_15300 [Ligilactobacillus agilis]|nr:polysaccharide biosynthesis C-terminal domain-containing protein [Ligilactobacillus agilis]GET15268.1 hypothetical protein SN4111_15300 [Ligilactobacillus agilis]
MIESVVIIIIGWSNAVGVQYLLPTNRVKEFTRSVVLGSVFNIILNIPLMKFWGLYGAMVSTVLSEVVVTGYQFWTIRNEIEFARMFTNLWKYILGGIVMFIPIFWLDITLHTSVISIAFEVVLGIFIYLLMMTILKPTILNKAKELIAKRRG